MPLVALLSNAAFDSEDTELLGAAFEAAWEKLNTAGSALAEGSEAALTRDCWRNALSRWRSGARETPIAWSRTLWIIWRDRERPRIALSRRHPLCSATRRPAVDQGRRAALRAAFAPARKPDLQYLSEDPYILPSRTRMRIMMTTSPSPLDG